MDISNWLKKVNLTKLALARAMAKATDWAMDKVFTEAVKNLSGPHYKPPARIPEIGTMPIPRVTGQLARSMNWMRLTPTVGAVFSDVRRCHYNKYVHDGTRYVKPRRFLGSVVTIWRPRIQMEFKRQILEAIRKEGLK